MAIIATLVLVVGISAAVASAVRLVRIGARDSGDLAAKLAIPFPQCAADWPELRVDALVPDPDRAARVLLLARWPEHPERRALLVLDVDGGAHHARGLLMQWRDVDASLSPGLISSDLLVLRRRRTTDVVIGVVVRETRFVGPSGTPR